MEGLSEIEITFSGGYALVVLFVIFRAIVSVVITGGKAVFQTLQDMSEGEPLGGTVHTAKEEPIVDVDGLCRGERVIKKDAEA